MAQDKQHTVTVIASSAVSAKRFVTFDGAHATTSDDVMGVSETAAAVGRGVSLITRFSAEVETQQVIAAGAWVKPANDGSGMAVATTRGDACGRARAASNAGLVEVLIWHAPAGLSAQQSAAAASMVAAPWVPLATPLLFAKTNQTVSRVATNTAADNTFQALYTGVLPGGVLGNNGSVRWEADVGFTDPATNVTNHGFQLFVGGVAICPEYSVTTAGQLFDNRGLEWHATGPSAQKYRGSFVKQSGSTVGFTTTAVDLSVDQPFLFSCRWSGATPVTDTLSLLALRAWAEYGA